MNKQKKECVVFSNFENSFLSHYGGVVVSLLFRFKNVLCNGAPLQYVAYLDMCVLYIVCLEYMRTCISIVCFARSLLSRWVGGFAPCELSKFSPPCHSLFSIP